MPARDHHHAKDRAPKPAAQPAEPCRWSRHGEGVLRLALLGPRRALGPGRPAAALGARDQHPEAGDGGEQRDMDQGQPVALDHQEAGAALDHQQAGEADRGREHEVPADPAHAQIALQPIKAKRAQGDGDRKHGLGADPEADRGDRARDQRRPPLRSEQQAEGQPELDDEQRQQQAVMVRPTDDRVGLDRGLEQEGEAGEQAGVAAEDRDGRPVERERAPAPAAPG